MCTQMLWDKDFVFVQGAYSICYKGVNVMYVLDLSLISFFFLAFLLASVRVFSMVSIKRK